MCHDRIIITMRHTRGGDQTSTAGNERCRPVILGKLGALDNGAVHAKNQCKYNGIV